MYFSKKSFQLFKPQKDSQSFKASWAFQLIKKVLESMVNISLAAEVIQ